MGKTPISSKTDQNVSIQSPDAGATIETDGKKQGESAVPMSNYWVCTHPDDRWHQRLLTIRVENILLQIKAR